ncbi:RICIN domain-containing protein [Streptomyces sp. NPDC051183]|uniref:RICIN domain-containing protein n=1 Tax=unclassified Streptomyces TaxID=2593676 RepID=UPI0034340DA8
MSRIVRSVLAIGASAAVLAAGVTVAVAAAEPSTPSVTASSVTAAVASPPAVQLKAEHSGKCLAIGNASLRNGTNATQSTCADDSENQKFDMVPTGAGTFELKFKHSGKCLDVESSGTTNGTVVQQWWCVGVQNQRWRLVMVDIANELYELRPAHTAANAQRCLNIASAGKDDGAAAQLASCSGSAAQKWRIQPVTAA